MKINEAMLEQQCLEWFQGLGWNVEYGVDIAPDSENAKRESYAEVLIVEKLEEALSKINPDIPRGKLGEVVVELLRLESPVFEINNRQFHKYVNDGIPIEIRSDESRKGDLVRIFDFENIDNNNFLVVNQFSITGKNGTRRPDIIVFVNGFPLAVLELKSPADKDADIWQAYEQMETYKQELPDLFAYNLACIISDGMNARIGSITAQKERYAFWRTLKTESDRPNFEFELETMVKGFFDRELLLDYLRYFVVFEDSAGGLVKKIAGYHQFHAVRVAVASTVTATNDVRDGKCGVVWHTQGSGKSISMCFYAAKIMDSSQMNNPTIVIVTDRTDLDGQLYQTFCHSKELLKERPKQAHSREELRELLKRPAGGILFTTIQKFWLLGNEQKFPMLSYRNNIVVISDEAHRSQYGLAAKIRQGDGKISYGYAKYLRDALPNAGFIGFTGTPISQGDRDTVAVFGDYVSIYDIKRAVEDKATVSIHYDARLADLTLEVGAAEIDEQVDEILESSEDYSDAYVIQQRKKWAALEKLVTTNARTKRVAKNLVEHFEERLNTLDGKAMLVCISRRACVQMYNQIVALRPEWAGTLDGNARPSVKDGQVRVVMTGNASDKEDLRHHVYDKNTRKNLERRYKDPNDSLKLVIVTNKWLTGFDVPSLHTLYIDKPMKGHNLMQAIARVNRVFKDKPNGLVVDYLGITSELKEALQIYTQSRGEGTFALDAYEALNIFLGKMNCIRDILRDVDYSEFTDSQKIFSLMADCCDYLLGDEKMMQSFCDLVVAATKANTICGTMPEAADYREELAFFQAVKAALAKKKESGKKISNERIQNALKQVLSKALVSDKIVDIFEAAGLQQPDISILSESFLEKVKNIKHKNLAVEMLKRLLKDEIKARTRSNIIQSQKYSELLSRALIKYKNRSIHNAQVIEELIQMAKDFKKDMERGKDFDLNEDELAFYDALANNESAIRKLGDETLKIIAKELTDQLKKSVTIDWAKRESVRAGIRLKIRRLLRKYKYPPDKSEQALCLVLEQAEGLSEKWAV